MRQIGSAGLFIFDRYKLMAEPGYNVPSPLRLGNRTEVVEIGAQRALVVDGSTDPPTILANGEPIVGADLHNLDAPVTVYGDSGAMLQVTDGGGVGITTTGVPVRLQASGAGVSATASGGGNVSMTAADSGRVLLTSSSGGIALQTSGNLMCTLTGPTSTGITTNSCKVSVNAINGCQFHMNVESTGSSLWTANGQMSMRASGVGGQLGAVAIEADGTTGAGAGAVSIRSRSDTTVDSGGDIVMRPVGSFIAPGLLPAPSWGAFPGGVSGPDNVISFSPPGVGSGAGMFAYTVYGLGDGATGSDTMLFGCASRATAGVDGTVSCQMYHWDGFGGHLQLVWPADGLPGIYYVESEWGLPPEDWTFAVVYTYSGPIGG